MNPERINTLIMPDKAQITRLLRPIGQSLETLDYCDASRELIQFAYTVTKYIEGVTLLDYIRNGGKFPASAASSIADAIRTTRCSTRGLK